MLFWMLWTPFAIAALLITLMFVMNAMELDPVGFLLLGTTTAFVWFLLAVPFL